MALRDVNEYYYTMLGAYVEAEQDLADFEQALKDGYITEDKLEAVKAELKIMKDNVDRIQYIMYLFSLPRRTKRHKAFKNINKPLEDYFKKIGVNTDSLDNENKNALDHLRIELKKLSNTGK